MPGAYLISVCPPAFRAICTSSFPYRSSAWALQGTVGTAVSSRAPLPASGAGAWAPPPAGTPVAAPRAPDLGTGLGFWLPGAGHPAATQGGGAQPCPPGYPAPLSQQLLHVLAHLPAVQEPLQQHLVACVGCEVPALEHRTQTHRGGGGAGTPWPLLEQGSVLFPSPLEVSSDSEQHPGDCLRWQR